jgi:16S rRNA (guanine(966)-N(2))-methyltransferase RsmD
LCAGNPAALEGSVWLDLYAGTGAVGIEALSRGAASVTFVDKSREAAEVIRNNIKSLGIEAGFAVVVSEARVALKRLAVSVDYVFLDPPYRLQQEYGESLRVLGDGQLVKDEGIVVAEHDRRFDPGEAHGQLRRYRTLRQGDAALSFYRRANVA